jgi:SagB-type dehydrogenase family enzyme
MSNADTAAAWAYHDATKHSLQSVQSSRHYLDWPNQPLPFKIYTTLEPLPLPREFSPSRASALDAIAGRLPAPPDEVTPDRAMIARLCYFSNGVTKILQRPGGEIAFRAAACTGALYHVELYVVCGDLPDLRAGVYQYAAHDHSLRQLRRGDYRGVLVDATGAEPTITRAPATLVCTSTFWRNAWKYQARAYRHSFWDTGTILANLFAVANANELPARLVLGFADAAVNRLLDVPPEKEAAICLVALGRTTVAPPPAPAVEPLNLPTERLSPREIAYPAIVSMHAASSLASGAEAAAWRAGTVASDQQDAAERPEPAEAVPLTPAPSIAAPSIEDVIRRRGSSRRFAREAIGFEPLATILDVATSRAPSDLPLFGTLTDPYLIVNAVDGLPSGAYTFDREKRALRPLHAGDFRETAGYLDLGQELARDATVNVYSLANLHAVLPGLGNRGYRAAQLEGAIEGGKLYLASYALGLGATGLTFFDDDVIRFFSPHAAGKSVMFLTAIGRPARRSRGLV